MTKISPLSAEKLTTSLDPKRITWENSDDIPRNYTKKMQQPRALKALEMALQIKTSGFNVFVTGNMHLGRSYMTKNFLHSQVKNYSTPPDLLYVYNFENVDQPILLSVPAGQGKKIQNGLSQSLSKIQKELCRRQETKSYRNDKKKIQIKLENSRHWLLNKMEDKAHDAGFTFEIDDAGGLAFFPIVDGQRLKEEDFEKLSKKVRHDLKKRSEALFEDMGEYLQEYNRFEEEAIEEEKQLEREMLSTSLDRVFKPFIEKTLRACPENPDLIAYFIALHQDMLNNVEALLPQKNQGQSLNNLHELSMQIEIDLSRYNINLFVDNSKLKGAPIIIAHHPTHAKLLGCIERRSEMGALLTDFSLIKAGAIHKANGGFLIIHLEDLLQYSNAFDAFMRALRNNVAQFEEADSDGAGKTKGLEPKALPLNLKVILIGTEYLYDQMVAHDDRFLKLFKIKAQMHDIMPRTANNIRSWLSQISNIIDDAKLLPFSREALASLVDYSSKLAEDQHKLSLLYPKIRDVMVEAGAVANMKKAQIVTQEHVKETLNARQYRQNLVEEIYLEEYDRELIKVSTSGEEIGRINGLSVSWYGDFEFGLPHQITCTVGVGHGGIIDLEREAELGGPIHTKAMLILKSYLVSLFARNKPIVLTGSLCFEQNYAGIEGDSASGAELAALLSAIAEVPLSNSLAFTGAVSQNGTIMAVGGVTRKIESFFNLCDHRGLSGKQGVIIPYDNRSHLILPSTLCDAVEKGLFAIYPVRHITEALELLTGMPAGRPLKNGTFTKDSLFDLVDKRLEMLAYLAENSSNKKPKTKKKTEKNADKE